MAKLTRPSYSSHNMNSNYTEAIQGVYGGAYPEAAGYSIKEGDTIPAGTQLVRVNGTLYCTHATSAPVTVSSFDDFSVNNGVIELFPVPFHDKVLSGVSIARNDDQLVRLMGKARVVGVAYTPVTAEGIFQLSGDIKLFPLLDKVLVDSRQFWLRAPRQWNESNKEYDYTPYDIRVVGNFHFNFSRQDSSFDPGVGLALQGAGTLEVSGCELEGAWNSNMTIDYGRWSIVDNVYSHDCGKGKIQDTNGGNRQGMAIIVGDAIEAHIHHCRTRSTWASSVFLSSKRPGRTLNVMIHDVSINTSGGNGLRIQSDDLVTGEGGGAGTAITRVNISNVTIKNCESHGLRANFTNGSVTGLYIEACNAGISIEGSSDVTYSNIIMKNCSQGLISRFYPVVCTRLRFANITISGHADWAVFFHRQAGSSHTVNLGDIEFDGLTIHCTKVNSKAVAINCGINTTATSDITLKNVRIVGAFAPSDNTALVQIENARHVEIDEVNFRGVNGNPSSYISIEASQSIHVQRMVGVQPFGTVHRPIEVKGKASHVNITNCSAPQTTVGYIGYTSPVPSSRYEANNQFKDSAVPQVYTFSNAGNLRGGDVNTMTTNQIAHTLATLIADLGAGKFVTR